MSTQQTAIYGLPYVPGEVSGVLSLDLHRVTSNTILLLPQSGVDSLQKLPIGFVVIDGAPLSHEMIKFLTLGLPTVMIGAEQARLLHKGVATVIDGECGKIIQCDDASLLPDITVKKIQHRETAKTFDGVVVNLRASVRNVSAVKNAVAAGAESIGLVRSEFLLPANDVLPDLDFYRLVFSELCEAAASRVVTIRLLDITADKLPACLSDLHAVGGTLGMQGVRLFKREPVTALLNAQLQAIHELSNTYNIRVLLPYVVCREEVKYWVAYLRKYLEDSTSIGTMVETPASALDFKHWFDVIDFVAIGTNDLMQCLFAADRNSAELKHYLDPYAPLLFRFLKQIADSANSQMNQIQLCGVLSQLPGVLPILLGLGYRNFSIDATMIPYLQQVVYNTSVSAAEELARNVCACIESHQVHRLLKIRGRPAGF